MKYKILLLAAGLTAATALPATVSAATAAPAATASASTAENGISFEVPARKMTVSVEWYTPSTVRVLKTPGGYTGPKESYSVIAKPAAVKFKTSTLNDGTLEMKSSRLTVAADPKTGVISFYTPDGEKLLAEDGCTMTPIRDVNRDAYTVSQSWLTDPNEGLYGLGQLQDGRLSHRNLDKYLVQTNIEDVTPLIQSNRGWGLFWDNYSGTTYSDHNGLTSFRSDVGDEIDYYFMYGGSMDATIAEIRSLTGQVPMMPLWSYGFMQSKERYTSQNEILSVVRKYRDLGVPLDVIIQDWQYWSHNYLWNAMDFLNPRFPDPQGMVDSIHAMNARMMISVWTSFGPATKPYRALDKEGLLFEGTTFPQWGVDGPKNVEYPSGVRVYDPYSPKSRDIYWDNLNNGLYKYGIDGWWLDATEPENFDWKDKDFDHITGVGRSYRSVRNAFPLASVSGVYDNQRALDDGHRITILTRSGFLGQQRYAANVWSGDVLSSWDMLRKQVPAGLNFSMLGMPHWNSDLGGFFAWLYNNDSEASGTRNPLYHELYVRWLQFGIFTPMMRSHGTSISREFFEYGKPGEPVYDALVDAVKLRYRILPYTYSLAWDVTNNQGTFMRPLIMDFPDDPKALDNAREYMYGDAFLVAPVLNAQYTTELAEKDSPEKKAKALADAANVDFTQPKSMEVYLPAGAKWYNYWTNELLDGGRTVDVATEFSKIPLFVRAGSIVVNGPEVQYTTEKPWDNLTVAVYPGADADFTLYEDAGDGYKYESGEYTEIPMKWNDRKRTLTIGARRGSYPGMITPRRFTVTLPDGTTRSVTYTGRKLSLHL